MCQNLQISRNDLFSYQPNIHQLFLLCEHYAHLDPKEICRGIMHTHTHTHILS